MTTLNNNMIIKHNAELSTGSYRIICDNCKKIFFEGNGDLTQAALKAMNYSIVCDVCGGEVVLEENFEIKPNKYDASHPYPFG